MLDKEQVLRYSRQLILNEIGYQGQETLLKSKVLVIGAGGLGSPALYYLAAAGVGTLGIADFDVTGISNLQRQILYFTTDIGKKKVDSAAEKLTALNPDVRILTYPHRVNIDNIEDLVEEYDIIIDAVDNFPARFLISDCCYFLKKPLVEGAVTGYDGILMTIIPDKSPCYRCLYPYPPEAGIIPACSDTGILGMITGVIGSLQALEAVKALLNIGQTLSGRVLTFDGLKLKFEEIPWRKHSSCPLCGETPTIKELAEHHVSI
jgi:adenylyltransferase/sulfurtransferase